MSVVGWDDGTGRDRATMVEVGRCGSFDEPAPLSRERLVCVEDLRADISDEVWATINSTVSRPFPRPRTGKLAVKVINHYGDEVMKVIGV